MHRLLVSAILLLASVAPATATPPPNVVVFLVDDLGWQDTSVPFHAETTALNRRFRTPNMERLAGAGMVFTDAYATPICSPTRVSLVTGLNAARHRVTNWTLRRGASNDHAHPTLEFPEWNVNGLSPVADVERTVHARALPSYLAEAGYRTIHLGKAHFGAIGTPGADPTKIGFDINIAGHAAGAPGSYYGDHDFSAVLRAGAGPNARVWDVPGLEKYHATDVDLTEALTREAVREIDDAVNDGTPFFLYLSHYTVHAPIMADSRFVENYPDLPKVEAAYASMIEAMDESLGEVLDTLERRGVVDRTVVLFMSDNGGLSAHARAGERHTHNRPLSSGKGSAHEGGIRVPMIVYWPGVTMPGTRSDVPVIVEDFFPSILEMAGITDAEQVGGVIDGVSFVPQLHGEPRANDRPLIWHLPNFWSVLGPGLGPASWIRVGRWKLIYYHAPYGEERFEFFDLETDIGETTNLIWEKSEIAWRVVRILDRELEARDAQWPRAQDGRIRGISRPRSALGNFYARAPKPD